MDYNEIFEYKDGHLYWLGNRSGKKTKGKQVGCLNPYGYRVVNLMGKVRYLHRIIWEMHNEVIPEKMTIDHLNHDRSDNRIENLRLCAKREQYKNQSRRYDNKSGCTGVRPSPTKGKWTANIKHHYKKIWLGTFDTLQEAIAARKQAEIDYGFHVNHGV